MEETIIDIYKQLLENEVSNHNIFITILLGIVVILLGATWWWNKTGAIKAIKQEVEDRIETEKAEIINNLSESLKKDFDEKVSNYEEKLLELEANISRAMAISANSQAVYTHSIGWWAKYLEMHLKLKNDERIRHAADTILREVEAFEEDEKKLKAKAKSSGKEYKVSEIYKCSEIIEIVNGLPNILEKERTAIIKKLKKNICDCNGEKLLGLEKK